MNLDDIDYEMCGHRGCAHFVEPNWPEDEVESYGLAAYVHLDDGEKEHDHDAIPSGDVRKLRVWQRDLPILFREFIDGKIGPNSEHFPGLGLVSS